MKYQIVSSDLLFSVAVAKCQVSEDQWDTANLSFVVSRE